jgi:hypothetical protein
MFCGNAGACAGRPVLAAPSASRKRVGGNCQSFREAASGLDACPGRRAFRTFWQFCAGVKIEPMSDEENDIYSTFTYPEEVLIWKKECRNYLLEKTDLHGL